MQTLTETVRLYSCTYIPGTWYVIAHVSLAIKMQDTNRSGGGEGGAGEPSVYVTPDLRYDYLGGREEGRAKIQWYMGSRKNERKKSWLCW